MKLNEFCKKAAANSLMEPDAIKLIMEKLMEMPLNEMYSEMVNRQYKRSYADEYLMEIIDFEWEYASNLRLKHFFHRMNAFSGDKSKQEEFRCCNLLLANWCVGFIPNIYRRKER